MTKFARGGVIHGSANYLPPLSGDRVHVTYSDARSGCEYGDNRAGAAAVYRLRDMIRSGEFDRQRLIGPDRGE